MISPPFLKAGDKIAIVATARKVSPAEMEPAILKFREWGLQVITGPHLFGASDQYSGTDDDRLSDLQMMLDDPSIKAIVAARGGYGTVRIIDKLDFNAFCSNPKWIVGYSDITVLHSHIHTQFGVETLHATMPINFPGDGSDNEATVSLKKMLFGEPLQYQIKPNEYSVKGNAEGILVGGNLSILYALNATPSDLDTQGKILFLEDLDEYLYHIDRMMLNLRRSGKLSGLAGLVIGGMTRMNDNAVPFGKTAEEIIREAVKGYSYPVFFGFPAGHIDENCAMILGRNVELTVDEKGTSLKFRESVNQKGSFKLLQRIIKPALVFLAFFILIYLLYTFLIPVLK